MEQALHCPVVSTGVMRSKAMLRFLTMTALAAALSSPAFAEPGFVKPVNLPMLGANYGVAPRAVCELPAYVSVRTIPAAPAESHAMTLSPRMIQAIRIGEEPSDD
ncbi:hypothetical protein [uncultured Bosea sp.]|uniref:hypothetical protein n=1 Tax=uncultured Bosea sp. TaxID=211457 RepID=UPI0025D31B4B|nr:hypothetical protein [uncultured Bosea sp.]